MFNQLASRLYNISARVRNPSLAKTYQEFKKSESYSSDEIESRQLKKIKELLVFSNQYSSFYKNHFAAVGFDPHSFNEFSDLKRIPSITKRDLLDNNQEIHADFPFKKVRKALTSGTSGEALSFMRSEKWDSANRAAVMRGYSWYDVKVSDKNGYFWGYNIDSRASRKIRILDSLQNRFRLFHYTDKEISDFCLRMQDATYLSGYSSMIYKIAKEVNKRGLKFDNIKMIKGTSEMILPKYQEEVQQAFGVNMISEYGAAETGLISFECPHGSQHINTDGVYVETDENNEVLITNLFSHSFPVIRYRLGDIVTLSEKKCSCGMESPLIGEIVGRKGANVVGKINEYPSLVFYYVFKNLASENNYNLNYKAYQSEVGKVNIYIESEDNPSIRKAINLHLSNYFKSDIQFDVNFVEHFTSDKKKQQSFTSYLE